MRARKRLLIISNGPPPTADQPVVEGGGLRCWGLAWGLRQNDPELEITVAYHEHYKKPHSPGEQDGIALATWGPDTLSALVGQFDAVLISYCMGTLSLDVARALRPDQRLILDCYVPIHVEVCARESRDLDGEYAAYHRDAGIWNEVLRRGDLMLYASPAQRLYYLGVLGANGRLNPITYGEDLLLRVPYGTYPDPPRPETRPISALVGSDGGKKILWFGGIYPWFDLRGLIDAVALVNQRDRATLTIVGARNPFNTHPDFVARSDELVEYASRPEFREVVKLQDWVGFSERADWYCDADLVVVVNKPGDENSLSWRTRLADFVWAGVPIVTNGGDPLGDRLIEAGASARFPSLGPEAIAETLHDLLSRPEALEQLRSRLAPFRDELRWDEVTRPLADWIGRGRRAADLVYEETSGHHGDLAGAAATGRLGRYWHRGRRLIGRAARHVQDHGLRATASKVRNRLAAKLGGRAAKLAKRDPAIVVLSHQLDYSGAPYALLDVVERMVTAGLGPSLEFLSYPPAEPRNLRRLRDLGLRPRTLPAGSPSPRFVTGDVLLLNTVGFPAPVRADIYDSLEHGILKKLIWYVHEDHPEQLFTPTETERVRRLAQAGKLAMALPAQGAASRFSRHFGIETAVSPFPFELPVECHRVLGPDDFESIRFILPGSVGDGRKGQLPVLYACATVVRDYVERDRGRYRDFTITFVGLEKSFAADQIASHQGILGGRLKLFDKVSREQSLKHIREANVTLCYSLRECLPMFVFEGMLAGHPIIRNECSGVDEQLIDGENGYLARGEDYWGLVAAIEAILDREKTPDEMLAAMSRRSYELAHVQRYNRAEWLVEQVQSAFTGDGPRSTDPGHAPHIRIEGQGGRPGMSLPASRLAS